MIRVYIEWYDAYTRDAWEQKDDAVKNCAELMPCKTVGWLLNEDKDQVTICHTFNPQCTMGMLHIPKGTIRRLRKFGK